MIGSLTLVPFSLPQMRRQKEDCDYAVCPASIRRLLTETPPGVNSFFDSDGSGRPIYSRALR